MIRTLIVADVRLFRDGLTHVLGSHPPFRVVGSISGDEDVVSEITRLSPDVVLIDMVIAQANPLIKRIRRAHGQINIVGLCVRESEADVLRCLESGVAGYVPHDGSIKDLVATLESVNRGEMVCPPKITAALAKRVTNLADSHTVSAVSLTYREKEVTALVDRGLSNKQIAERLNITRATVKNHVHNVLKKLRIHTRREVAGHVMKSPEDVWRTVSSRSRVSESPPAQRI